MTVTVENKTPLVDQEYTREQRRIIDNELAEAAEGPFHGPFNSADEMIVHIQGQLKKRAAGKKPKPSR